MLYYGFSFCTGPPRPLVAARARARALWRSGETSRRIHSFYLPHGGREVGLRLVRYVVDVVVAFASIRLNLPTHGTFVHWSLNNLGGATILLLAASGKRKVLRSARKAAASVIAAYDVICRKCVCAWRNVVLCRGMAACTCECTKCTCEGLCSAPFARFSYHRT